MASLQKNIEQTISDFDGIKEAIEAQGVEVPYDTDTSEYGKLIKSIPSYDKGCEAYRKAWWDSYTNNNAVKSQQAMFSRGWTDFCFDPPYQLKPTNLYAGFGFSKITKISKSQMDTSLCTNFYRCYQQSIQEIEELSLKSATNAQGLFRDSYCHTVGKMIFAADGSTVLTDIFGYASRLKNVYEVEGLIAGASLNAQYCPWTAATAINFIKCLKDYSGTENEGVYTITFSSATLSALDAEGNTSPNGGLWTDYVSALGWILG